MCIDKALIDFFRVYFCEVASVDNDCSDFRANRKRFNLNWELANVRLLAFTRANACQHIVELSPSFVAQEFVLELAQAL